MIILFVEEGLRRLTTAQRDENKVYEIKGVEVCVLRNLLLCMGQSNIFISIAQ